MASGKGRGRLKKSKKGKGPKKSRGKKSGKWYGFLLRPKMVVVLGLLCFGFFTSWPATTLLRGAVKFFYPSHYDSVTIEGAHVSVFRGVTFDKLKISVPIKAQKVSVSLREVSLDLSYLSLVTGELKLGKFRSVSGRVDIPETLSIPFDVGTIPFSTITLLNQFDAVVPKKIELYNFKALYGSKKQTVGSLLLEIDNGEKEYAITTTDLKSTLFPEVPFFTATIKIAGAQWRFSECTVKTPHGGELSGALTVNVKKKLLTQVNVDLHGFELGWIAPMVLDNDAQISGSVSGKVVLSNRTEVIKGNALSVKNLVLESWPFQKKFPLLGQKALSRLQFSKVSIKDIALSSNRMTWRALHAVGDQISIIARGSISQAGALSLKLKGVVAPAVVKKLSYSGRLALGGNADGAFKGRVEGSINDQSLILDGSVYGAAIVNQFKNIGTAFTDLFE
ncbi:MAG: hypothetical protein OCC49_16430 [Fibrobacterales bacterium]